MTEQCPSENELLTYLRHALAPEAKGRLERHLDGCRACHQLCVELLRAGSRVVPPPTLPTVDETAPGPRDETPSELLLRPGSVIGRYTVVERLGEGGMGVVFAAYDRELDRKVALKVSRPRP